MGESAHSFVGRQLKFPIYSTTGHLLLPALTMLEEKHLDLLERNNISIDASALDSDNPLEEIKLNTGAIIDEATIQLKNIFHDITYTGHIPILEIETTIAPSIYQAIDTPFLSNLLVELEITDEYTYRHNIGVSIIATLIGKWMKLPEDELNTLTMAAILHDVGKTKIPYELLTKPGKLSKEEYELIKRHTTFGFDLIKNNNTIDMRLAHVALLHHEREDGLGYPLGIKGNKIDQLSKIVAVADVFHAMTSKRSYHDAKPFYQVVKEMHHDTFGKLDPKVTSVFLSKIMTMLIGEYVLLTNGKSAQIIMINQSDLLSPVVSVGNLFIDLSKDKSLAIEKIIKAPVLA